MAEQTDKDKRHAKEDVAREERRTKEAASRERSKGKTPKGTLEKRAAREEAKKYNIDTSGMSTKEIKGAVSEAKKVEEDMMKFIEKSLNNFTTKKGDAVAPMDIPITTISRTTEDKITPLAPAGGTPKSRWIGFEGEGGGGNDNIPPPPTEGIYVLGSIGGTIQWIETEACEEQANGNN